MKEDLPTNRMYLMGGILALTVFLSALLLEEMYGMPQLVFPPAPIPNHVRSRAALRRPAASGTEEEKKDEGTPEAPKALEDMTTEERVQYLLDEGERFFDGGNIEGAAELYTAALELDPENVASLSGLGAADFMLARFSEAERSFSKLLRHDAPDKALIRLALGATKRRQGRFGPALGDVMIALAGRPEDPAVHVELACLYGVLGAPGRAISHFERAYRLDGTALLAHISDPHLDPIRSNEIFRAILQQARAKATVEKATAEAAAKEVAKKDAAGETPQPGEDNSPE